MNSKSVSAIGQLSIKWLKRDTMVNSMKLIYSSIQVTFLQNKPSDNYKISKYQIGVICIAMMQAVYGLRNKLDIWVLYGQHISAIMGYFYPLRKFYKRFKPTFVQSEVHSEANKNTKILVIFHIFFSPKKNFLSNVYIYMSM